MGGGGGVGGGPVGLGGSVLAGPASLLTIGPTGMVTGSGAGGAGAAPSLNTLRAPPSIGRLRSFASKPRCRVGSMALTSVPSGSFSDGRKSPPAVAPRGAPPRVVRCISAGVSLRDGGTTGVDGITGMDLSAGVRGPLADAGGESEELLMKYATTAVSKRPASQMTFFFSAPRFAGSQLVARPPH